MPLPDKSGRLTRRQAVHTSWAEDLVESWNCVIAENITGEYEKANVPNVVSMTFTSGSLVLPMKCLPAGRAEVCRGTNQGPLFSQTLVVGFIP
jgi:hypothetical protein